jgi:glutathione S-transferase
MIAIWGRLNSHNTKKVVWGAIEAGVAWERHDMGGSFGYTEAYLAMNPNRLVPTIVDGAFSLYESNAILRYLADAYAPHLRSADPHDRARGEQWLDWQFAFADAQRDAFLGCVRGGKDGGDAQVAASATAAGAMMRILDAALAAQPWLSGAAFGIADIPMGVYAHTFFTLPIVRPDVPHVRAWYERLLGRPGFATIAEVPLT